MSMDRPLKVLSLFSGAGGLDLGFKQAGFDIVAAFDMNKDCCSTYKKNIGNHITKADLSIFDKKKLSTGVDLVIGGPPCQGFSVLGRMNKDDHRSQLIFAYAEMVGHVQPKMFVMENVPALATLAKWTEVKEALEATFERYGYTVRMFILNAEDYGVPQKRKRVFFIGARQPLIPPKQIKVPRGTKILTAGDVLRSLPPPGISPNLGVCQAVIRPCKNPILRASPYAGSLLFNGKGRPINLDGPALTLPASMGGNATPIIDEAELRHRKKPWIIKYHKQLIDGEDVSSDIPDRLRRLTVTEAKLLQSFPLDYAFDGTQCSQFRQIGNAVPPKMAHAVALTVKEILLT